MTTYVKYLRNSDFGSRFGYGYVDGYLTDRDGNYLVVIATKEKKLVTRSIKSVDIVSKQEYDDNEESYW
jgi:hypothetical protein